MNQDRIREIIIKIKSGTLGEDEAFSALKNLPYEDMGFAKIDSHRALRRSLPEVIFCQTKTNEQVLGIVEKMIEKGHTSIGTRVSQEMFDYLNKKLKNLEYFREARIFRLKNAKIKMGKLKVAVITAGTSDIPAAEEAAVTLESFGVPAERIYDVGVAGIHRLFDQMGRIDDCRVIIAAAGMEGALPGVVAGLTDKPVIAVPTSVGYGASFGGISPLLTALNSCSGGIGVVNIDNGFGAAYLAALVIKQIERGSDGK